MSDRLRFRAWDGESMRYDVTGFEHGHKNEMTGVFLDGDYFAIVDRLSECDEYNPGAVVMQWTGLCDRKDKEVFQGDIVNYRRERGFISEVVWCYEGCCFMFGDNEIGENISRVSVIGNIYENPQLLEPTP